MLELRIPDKVFLRLIKKWQASISEEPGAVVPHLGNVREVSGNRCLYRDYKIARGATASCGRLLIVKYSKEVII